MLVVEQASFQGSREFGTCVLCVVTSREAFEPMGKCANFSLTFSSAECNLHSNVSTFFRLKYFSSQVQGRCMRKR